MAPERVTQRLDAAGGRPGQHRLFGVHVSIEEPVQGVEKLDERTGVLTVPAGGSGVRHLSGQVPQTDVIAQECLDPPVCQTLPDEGEEQAFRGDRLVEDLERR